MNYVFSKSGSFVPNNISDLQKYVWKMIHKQEYDDFCTHLKNFGKVVSDWMECKSFIPELKSDETKLLLNKHFEYVVKLHNAMNEANLYSSIYYANLLLKSLDESGCINTIDFVNDSYYRVRNSRSPLSNPQELFHVPFEKRSIISPNRFSIAGFPCLYISNSLDCCIEEVDVKEGEEMYASVFVPTKALKVLDLRFWRNVEIGEINKYFLLLPLLISCSYEAKISGYYVPEYNIPQLMMHYILKSKYKENIDGIAYSSTKIQNTEVENYVFPVKNIKLKGLCDRLMSNFKNSIPQMVVCKNGTRILSEQELLKNLIF